MDRTGHRWLFVSAMLVMTGELATLFYFCAACAWLTPTPRTVTVGNRLR